MCFLRRPQNWRTLHRWFDSYYIMPNWWIFCHFLWPSLKTWTLQPHLPAATTFACLNLKLHNPNDISAPVFGLENSPNFQCQWPWFSDTGPLVIVTVSGRPLCTEQLINHYNWWVVAPFILLFIMAMWCEIAICCTY